MSTAELILTGPVVPDFPPDDSRGRLREHPAFCGVCLSLSTAVADECHGLRENLTRFLDEVTWEFWSSLADIKYAATSGCATCQLLRLAIDGAAPNHTEWTDEFCEDRELIITINESTTLNVYLADELCIDLYSHPSTRGALPWSTIKSKVQFNNETGAHPWIGGEVNNVEIDPSSSACIDLIRGWIRTCEESHSHCSVKRSVILPKRVIAVGHNSSFDDVHLFETHGQRGDYLALSHCWGPSMPLTLKAENLSMQKQNIPWQELSRTFQDAIIMTRKLGYKYIWIDSLCIIQNSEADWKEESAKMALIYQQAFLVISASRSKDGSEGCFAPRVPSYTISGRDVTDQRFKLYARQIIDHSAHCWGVSEGVFYAMDAGRANPYKGYSEWMLEHCPLFTRAWCYQERLLAQRTIHFEEREVVWECLTCTNCECGAMSNHQTDFALILRRLAAGVIPDIGLPTTDDEEAFRAVARPFMMKESLNLPFEEFKLLAKSLSWLSYFSIGKRPGNGGLLVRKFLQQPESAQEMMFRCWRNIAADYSARKLTYQTDALVALSGLASRWQSKDTGRYLAGIWENDFLRSLAWQTSGPEMMTNSYIAPSWSWASTGRSVHFVLSSGNLVPHFQINCVECTPDLGNLYGKVTQAYASLHVCLIKGTLTSCDEDGDTDPAGMFVHTVDAAGRMASFSSDRCAEVRSLIGETVFCMRLCRDEMSNAGTYFERCLVLRRADEQNPVYERIGFMTLQQPIDAWDLVTYPEKIMLI